MSPLPTVQPFTAHQGGWDEMLIVAGPIVVFLVIRWLSSRFGKHDADKGVEDE